MKEAYNFQHDMNPDIRWNAKDQDPPRMKRKVIRGGSWKDVGYFLQTSTRAYEYQDTAKSYIGFRCVIDLPPVAAKKAKNKYYSIEKIFSKNLMPVLIFNLIWALYLYKPD